MYPRLNLEFPEILRMTELGENDVLPVAQVGKDFLTQPGRVRIILAATHQQRLHIGMLHLVVSLRQGFLGPFISVNHGFFLCQAQHEPKEYEEKEYILARARNDRHQGERQPEEGRQGNRRYPGKTGQRRPAEL